MTFTGVEAEPISPHEMRIMERAEYNKRNMDAAAQDWALATVTDMLKAIDSSSFNRPYFVGLFTVDDDFHDKSEPTGSADMHDKAHSYFTKELNLVSSTILASDKDTLQLPLLSSYGLLYEDAHIEATIQRHDSGEAHTVIYYAVPSPYPAPSV